MVEVTEVTLADNQRVRRVKVDPPLQVEPGDLVGARLNEDGSVAVLLERAGVLL